MPRRRPDDEARPTRRRSRRLKNQWRLECHSHHAELLTITRQIAAKLAAAAEALSKGLPDTASELVIAAVKLKVERDKVRRQNTASMSLRYFARSRGVPLNEGFRGKWGAGL